jgi:hypothetical protein
MIQSVVAQLTTQVPNEGFFIIFGDQILTYLYLHTYSEMFFNEFYTLQFILMILLCKIATIPGTKIS